MDIRFNRGNFPMKIQPVVVADRGASTQPPVEEVARVASEHTRATFSSESLKMLGQSIDVNKPETVRSFLSNFDFRHITPKDLAFVGGVLYEAGAIQGHDAANLVGTELAYEVPLDPNKAIDSFKVFDDVLAASMAAGPMAIAGRPSDARAAEFIRQLASFATSDRSEI
ncbi:MAG TPA: hypothetical protein VFY35_07855 [Burkholderiaceae bacterium]|nr:hypothetical protein [Burkholderiaceae bacterium]